MDLAKVGRVDPSEVPEQRREPEAMVGTQRDENNAEHRHQGGHPHPDYARGEHPEELDTEVPDFARGQRHGEAVDLEGNYASGPEEGPTIPADHGDFARGERHVDPD